MFDNILKQIKNRLFADTNGKPSLLGQKLGAQPIQQKPAPTVVPKPQVVNLPKIGTTVTVPNKVATNIVQNKQPGISRQFIGGTSNSKAVLGTKITPTPTLKVPVSKPTVTPTPTYIPRTGVTYEELKQIAPKILKEAGIPLAVGMAQLAAEGRDKGLGAKRNNFYNINGVDSDPNLAFSYRSPEEGIKAYTDLIKRRYASALKAGNPAKILKEIERLGYAGNPRTWRDRKLKQDKVATPYSSYSDFAMNTPEYREYLEE